LIARQEVEQREEKTPDKEEFNPSRQSVSLTTTNAESCNQNGGTDITRKNG